MVSPKESAFTAALPKRVGGMNASVFDLVSEQCGEGDAPHSPVEALGTLQLHMQRLVAELALPDEEQDADKVLQELVGLAAVAIATVSVHVLPVIGGAR